MMKVHSDKLGDYDENTPIFVPRSTISFEIVRLQNDGKKTDKKNKQLISLINTLSSETNDSIQKRRFVRMSVKSVRECFNDKVVTVYVDD